MTPDEHREHATELILDGARYGKRLSVLRHLELAGVEHTAEDAKVIFELIHTATITLEFPERVIVNAHPWQEYNAHGNTCHYPGCRLTEEEHRPNCNVAGCDHTRPEECKVVRCGTCGEPYDGTEPPAAHIARAHLDILARERFTRGGIVRSDVTADNPGSLGRSCMHSDVARVFVIAGNDCCGGNGVEASCEVCRRD